MAKVTIRTPQLISLEYRQQKEDPDYGTCLWAIFNFDTERYELTITSDCGNYAYGWTPTPNSESFMHLMARVEAGYLLDKIASQTVIDEKATFEAVQRLIETYGVDPNEMNEYNEPAIDLEEVKRACDQNYDREVYDALREAFQDTPMEWCDDYDLWNCISKDFTTSAKKIAHIFTDHIRPMCKNFSEQEAHK